MRTLLCKLIASLALASGAAAAQPNVLFILADDLGWGDLSCYGNTRFKTPHLDKLAKQGTLFTQYYQGGSVCSPTRATLLTGRWPAELGLHGHLAGPKINAQRGMPDLLDPKAITLPSVLKMAGYHTLHVGKWHLGKPADAPNGPEMLQTYGFDETYWLDVQGELEGKQANLWDTNHRPVATAVLVDATIAALTKPKNKPFFCELWLNDPHAPLAPSQAQRKPFREKQTPQGLTSPLEVYAATVTEMDAQLGRLFAKLEELKLAENTLVIFTSDNGPEDPEIGNAAWSGAGSAGPLRGRKRSLYEGGTRVPFLVRWPSVTPPAQVNDTTVVSGADIFPTLAEAAAATLPEAAQARQRGQSVLAALKGDKSLKRTKPLLWEWRFRVANHPWNRSPMLAIRDGDWKLLFNPDNSRTELYNIPNDPAEQDNLADQQKEVVARLREQSLAWQKTLPAGLVEPAAGKNRYPWPKE
jgi:arylsulfatase A-like enzyme